MAAASSERFDNINLLRAFAALAVVVYHVIEHAKWGSFPSSGALTVFRIGWIGVDLFFVISGFVITYSALALYRQDPGTFQERYWRRRLTRIVPLYLLTAVLWVATFGRSILDEPASRLWGQTLAHLTFTHSWFHNTHSAIDGPNWTLAIEMQFYFAIAMLLPWIARTPGWRIWLYGIAVSWAWRACLFALNAGAPAFDVFMGVTQLPGTLDEFGAGIFLAKWMIERPRPSRGETAAWLALAVIGGWIAMAVYWPRADYWPRGEMVVFWRTLLAAMLLGIVAAAVRLPGTIARALAPVAYLGEVSYGIYLWHLFAVMYFIHTLGLTALPALAAVAAATIAAAALSWHVYERPFMRLGRREPSGVRALYAAR